TETGTGTGAETEVAAEVRGVRTTPDVAPAAERRARSPATTEPSRACAPRSARVIRAGAGSNGATPRACRRASVAPARAARPARGRTAKRAASSARRFPRTTATTSARSSDRPDDARHEHPRNTADFTRLFARERPRMSDQELPDRGDAAARIEAFRTAIA